jgi:hypothetical protein
MVIKNKRGWIEILEAFISIMLVAAVILIAISKGNISEDVSEKIYKVEISILREIQTNDELRAEIGSLDNSTMPLSWDNFPAEVKAKIVERTPNYLECIGRICNLDNTCNFDGTVQQKNVYSESVIISSTILYGVVYRKLNLFCWQKG